MKKIEPNSLEAVVLFALYVCSQDGKISDEELKELSAELPVLKKLYFDLALLLILEHLLGIFQDRSD